MTEDEKQDAIGWLEVVASDTGHRGDVEAKNVLIMLRAAETRENTVLGMCLAQRPHTEIRDYLLAAGSDA